MSEQINSQVERYRYEANIITDSVAESTQWHLDIIDAILDKGLKKARKLLKDHIWWSFEKLTFILYGIKMTRAD